MSEESCIAALNAARGILDRTIDPLDGCRTLVAALHRCGPPVADHPAALVVRGVESETDDLPSGTQRELWEPSALSLLDAERHEYWRHVESSVREACAQLVEILEVRRA